MAISLFGSKKKEEEQTNKPGFLERMKQAVTRTRESLSERIESIVSFGKQIDRETLDDLEATLIAADLGTATTDEVLEKLRAQADRKQIGDVAELKRLLKQELLAILNAAVAPARDAEPPELILAVGLNGTGKTQTIPQLPHPLGSDGKSVLLCSADTFR